MTWVKICGITNLEDALTAVEAGADALGFVFYEKSPRNIDAAAAREIVRQLPERVERIGVFVGRYSGNLPNLIRSVGLTGTQVHFGPGVTSASQPVCYDAAVFPPSFKSYHSVPADIFIGNQAAAKHFIESIAHARQSIESPALGAAVENFFQTIFLDSSTLQLPGGTGKAFDWRKAAPVVEYMKQTLRIVVAGGLTATNVGEAIRILKPWGVDVASGVEARPGKKDPEKVKAFVAAVRETDKVH